MEGDGPLNPESGKRGMPLLYTRLNDAANAFEPERNLMTQTFGLDGGAAIAADGVGDVYVAWHAKALGAPAGEAGRQVWVTKSINDGKTFSAEGHKHPRIAIAPNGDTLLVWTEGTGWGELPPKVAH